MAYTITPQTSQPASSEIDDLIAQLDAAIMRIARIPSAKADLHRLQAARAKVNQRHLEIEDIVEIKATIARLPQYDVFDMEPVPAPDKMQKSAHRLNLTDRIHTKITECARSGNLQGFGVLYDTIMRLGIGQVNQADAEVVLASIDRSLQKAAYTNSYEPLIEQAIDPDRPLSKSASDQIGQLISSPAGMDTAIGLLVEGLPELAKEWCPGFDTTLSAVDRGIKLAKSTGFISDDLRWWLGECDKIRTRQITEASAEITDQEVDELIASTSYEGLCKLSKSASGRDAEVIDLAIGNYPGQLLQVGGELYEFHGGVGSRIRPPA